MNKKMIMFLCIGLQIMESIQSAATKEIQTTTAQITVFVHGTHRTNNALGYIPGVGKYLYHPEGLYKPEECIKGYVYRSLAQSITEASPVEFPKEHFYIFCWSGALSHDKRVQAAYELHEALNRLVEKYENNCIVTLITHSHGGNVALNLVQVPGERKYSIDSLILLAVPVQCFTQKYVEDALFKNVYSLYSRWDLIQIVDPQGLDYARRMISEMVTKSHRYVEELQEAIPFFSQRKFASAKVKHIEVRHHMSLGDRPIMHIEFILSHFTSKISTILKQAAEYDFTKAQDMIFNFGESSFFDTFFKA